MSYLITSQVKRNAEAYVIYIKKIHRILFAYMTPEAKKEQPFFDEESEMFDMQKLKYL